MNNDIRTLVIDLPTSVKGFVYLDSSNTPCIVLNARMTAEIQKDTYRHELDHIRHGDIDNMDYKEYSA